MDTERRILFRCSPAPVSRAKAALNAEASPGEFAADYDVDRSTLYRRVEQLRREEQ